MRHWDKPPPDTPDPFEARWLREKREREAEALRQLEKKLMHAMNHYDREKLIPHPEPAPIVRGDYLVYYLGGPLNCTQEYFWDKQMPKDRDWRDVPDPVSSLAQSPDNPAAHQLTVRVNRYMILVVPKNETPFSTVQVYLALYQEPPL